MPEEGELVFVYGSLRSGGSNAARMEGAEFLCEASVPGFLYRAAGAPGLVVGKLPDPRVRGELYRVSVDHLQRLDELEGLDPRGEERGDRRRTRVLAQSVHHAGPSWEAWSWEWTGATDPANWITSGDWFDDESRGFSDRLRRFPWFTWIGLVCLVSAPLWLLGAPVAYHYLSPLARLFRGAMLLAAALSPFVSLAALWLARRRGERDGGLFGCLLTLALMASGAVAIVVVRVIADSIHW